MTVICSLTVCEKKISGLIYNCGFLFSFRETESPLLAQPGPCNVDVREASTLTQKQFLNEYVPFNPQTFG